MDFDEFLKSAWQDHGDHPGETADQIAASLPLVKAPEQIVAFTSLATHVFGEHLGQWQRGISVLEALRTLPAYDRSPAVDRAVTRGVAALRAARGDAEALALLLPEDRVAVLANAASMLAGRREFKPALSAYSEALRLAGAGLPEGSLAIRALAVGGNNLAAALEEKADRDAEETEGMVAAAVGALAYWKQAGTWLQEERAEYRLARSLLQAGQAREAVRSAERCVAICRSFQAPAVEQFLGHAVLALAQRAAGEAGLFAELRRLALQQFDQVPAEERQWCEPELKELGG